LTVPVIAIDGPSASGKGTVARRVARVLGFHYLESGALYRLVALAARAKGISESDEARLAREAAALDAKFSDERTYLAGRDVGDDLYTEECGRGASAVAQLPAVRSALLVRQRAFRVPPGLVADGRDMGTVVFPDAALKVFLTATAWTRAERRYRQLRERQLPADLEALARDLEARDRRDAERTHAPLKPAPDAHVLDTTGLSIDGVVERVLALYRRSS
jgi:cytidylate kinase